MFMLKIISGGNMRPAIITVNKKVLMIVVTCYLTSKHEARQTGACSRIRL